MNCRDIEKHLSAFIDNALDDEIRPRVEEHIASCTECAEKLSALQSVSNALGDLPIIKAPSDFMENLHKRIKPESFLKKLFRTLFVPFRIKIPIEFATAAMVGVLVFFVTTTQQDVKQLPVSSMEKRAFEVNEPLTQMKDTPVVRKEEERQNAVMPSTVPSPAKAEGSEPFELALVIMPKVTGRLQTQPVEMEYTSDLKKEPAAEEKQKISESPLTGLSVSEKTMSRSTADTYREGRTEDEAGEDQDKANSYYTPSAPEPGGIMIQVKSLIEQINGRIVTVKDNKDSGHSLNAEIPADKYDNFLNQLKPIADFKTPPPDVSIKDMETIRINIRIVDPG
ncbi:MAG: zf-HC2 domain-containing protein [Desulfobacterales bacterium]|nr:zf-HC2 domain-containing protein [Desulfobacterales bacterium]